MDVEEIKMVIIGLQEVDKVSSGLNIPCGCEARQNALNKIVPYKMKKR